MYCTFVDKVTTRLQKQNNLGQVTFPWTFFRAAKSVRWNDQLLAHLYTTAHLKKIQLFKVHMQWTFSTLQKSLVDDIHQIAALIVTF